MWEVPSFDEAGAIEIAETFIEKLWDKDLAPANCTFLMQACP
jgi:hypothetical protein